MAPYSELFELAVQHHQAGNLAQAERYYRQVLENDSHAAHAHSNLGLLLCAQSKTAEAIGFFQQACRLAPNYLNAHLNLGSALAEQGQYAEAMASFQHALGINPNDADAHYNMGKVFFKLEQYAEAADCFRHVVHTNPNHEVAHNNLGIALLEQGQIEEAANCFRDALRVDAHYAEAYYNLGNVLRLHLGQPTQAEECYRRALRINPNFAGAWNNLGNILKDQGLLAEANACYARALDLKPEDAQVHSNIVHTLHYLPDQDADSLLAESRRWNERHALPLKKFVLPHVNDPSPERRLRIGYLSPDLGRHPVGYFMLPLLEAHDHTNFEIFCYYSRNVVDSISERCQASADVWRPIYSSTDEQAAQLIRQDRIDILVDLTMHLANNRLLVFARKPAPVQVTYLAYASGTGLDTMDYRLTDPYLDPPTLGEHCYTEKSIHLPRTYWCYKPMLEAGDVTPLPCRDSNVVTFGCLNNFCKATAATFETWKCLLQSLPDSRLLLHATVGNHRDRVRGFFAGGNVAPEQLVFVDRLPIAEYFRVYDQIDIALDPFPFGGGTTTCDALWMGVPVVSLSGQTAVGRGGLSILSNVGLAELVAQNAEQYVRIAVELARDRPRLSNLRATLRERMRNSPLMDAPRFARDIEAAYRRMWHDWCRQQCR
jgi:protein O-GlcNAc transferase